MEKNIKKVLPIALAALTVFTSCGNKQQKQTGSFATFKTMIVEKGDIQLKQEYTASIRGRQDIEVYPQVAGTLKQLCVTEGQTVKKGQTLFVVDQVPYQAALNTAEATLKASQAQEATAQLNYESRKKLFDQQVVSEFDFQTANNALLSAKAAVAQAKAMVVNAKNNLSYTVVTSPSDGVVGTLPYRLGALVSSAMPQPLTTVSDNSQMYVYFSMTESQLLQLSREKGGVEQAIAQLPEVSLLLVDGTEYGHKGKVESVSGVVDARTGSVQLRAVFDNPDKLLRSGSTGRVVIPIVKKDVIVIPALATVQSQDKFKVYTVDKDGIAHETLIVRDPSSPGDKAIVTEGLSVGDEIVAEGAGMVRDGQPVRSSK